MLVVKRLLALALAIFLVFGLAVAFLRGALPGVISELFVLQSSALFDSPVVASGWPRLDWQGRQLAWQDPIDFGDDVHLGSLVVDFPVSPLLGRESGSLLRSPVKVDRIELHNLRLMYDKESRGENLHRLYQELQRAIGDQLQQEVLFYKVDAVAVTGLALVLRDDAGSGESRVFQLDNFEIKPAAGNEQGMAMASLCELMARELLERANQKIDEERVFMVVEPDDSSSGEGRAVSREYRRRDNADSSSGSRRSEDSAGKKAAKAVRGFFRNLGN